MDEKQLIVLITYVTVVAGATALVMLLRDLFFKKSAESRSLLRQSIITDSDPGKSMIGRFDVWFARLVYQSGLGIGVGAATLAILFFALLVGGALFTFTEDPLISGAGSFLGALGFLTTMLVVRRKRMAKLETELPAAIELMARAVRSGQSLEQAVVLASQTSTGPAGKEFDQCAKQLEMGLSIAACMKSLARRMNIFDIKILSSTIAIHRETGGNLSTTLERLANVIRARAEYRGQLKSVTGAGRFSIGVIAILGPLLFAYLFLVQPQYGEAMWADPIGKWLLIFAAVAQILGLLWVSKVLKPEY